MSWNVAVVFVIHQNDSRNIISDKLGNSESLGVS